MADLSFRFTLIFQIFCLIIKQVILQGKKRNMAFLWLVNLPILTSKLTSLYHGLDDNHHSPLLIYSPSGKSTQNLKLVLVLITYKTKTVSQKAKVGPFFWWAYRCIAPWKECNELHLLTYTLKCMHIKSAVGLRRVCMGICSTP